MNFIEGNLFLSSLHFLISCWHLCVIKLSYVCTLTEQWLIPISLHFPAQTIPESLCSIESLSSFFFWTRFISAFCQISRGVSRRKEEEQSLGRRWLQKWTKLFKQGRLITFHRRLDFSDFDEKSVWSQEKVFFIGVPCSMKMWKNVLKVICWVFCNNKKNALWEYHLRYRFLQ